MPADAADSLSQLRRRFRALDIAATMQLEGAEPPHREMQMGRDVAEAIVAFGSDLSAAAGRSSPCGGDPNGRAGN